MRKSIAIARGGGVRVCPFMIVFPFVSDDVCPLAGAGALADVTPFVEGWPFVSGCPFIDGPCPLVDAPCPFESASCPFESAPCPFVSAPCPFVGAACASVKSDCDRDGSGVVYAPFVTGGRAEYVACSLCGAACGTVDGCDEEWDEVGGCGAVEGCDELECVVAGCVCVIGAYDDPYAGHCLDDSYVCRALSYCRGGSYAEATLPVSCCPRGASYCAREVS